MRDRAGGGDPEAMATQETRGAEGPGNKVIATTLLEALAVRGRSVAAERAARALEAQGTELAAAPARLADDAIPTLFAAAEVEVGLARRWASAGRAGHDRSRLYGLGPRPGKGLSPGPVAASREAAGASWAVESIDGRTASPPIARARRRAHGGAACALRRGMLEAIPGLYRTPSGWRTTRRASRAGTSPVATSCAGRRVGVGARSPVWRSVSGSRVGRSGQGSSSAERPSWRALERWRSVSSRAPRC